VVLVLQRGAGCWGGVKQIKTGKRSHLSGESTEKRSIIFANAKVTQGRMKSDRLYKVWMLGGTMFCSEMTI